jgi:hypothetical protein
VRDQKRFEQGAVPWKWRYINILLLLLLLIIIVIIGDGLDDQTVGPKPNFCST